MSVYTLAFAEDEDATFVFGPNERLDVAAELMAGIGSFDGDAIIALPAGFVTAPSTEGRDDWADGLASVSRSAGVALVFGIDVEGGERWGLERCPRSFAYACDRGRRLVWDAAPSERARALGERTVALGGLRATLLFGRELFGARAAPAVEAARPDLVLVLGHGGPTKRWLPGFAAVDELAPTLVVHQALEVRRPVTLPAPRGWRPTVTRGAVRVVCYRREPDGASARVVGH
jgi:hypothetical protein